MQRQYLTTHNDWNQKQMIALVVPAGDSEEAYLHGEFGVFIDTVMVNGAPIEPRTGVRLRDDVDARRVSTDGLGLVYKFLLRKIEAAAPFTSEESAPMATYEVPIEADRIEVRYRPRFGPDILGEPCVVVSVQV